MAWLAWCLRPHGVLPVVQQPLPGDLIYLVPSSGTWAQHTVAPEAACSYRALSCQMGLAPFEFKGAPRAMRQAG